VNQDLELEQKLLKACIDSPRDFELCAEMVQEDLFSMQEHKDVWNLMLQISEDGENPTRERLEVRSGALGDRSRTALYVIFTIEQSCDVSDAIRVLKECEYRRRIRSASMELYRRAESGRIKDVDHLLTSLQSLSDSPMATRPRGILSPREVYDSFVCEIEDELKGNHEPKLMSTGIESIDREENNFDGHRLIVLLGETGHGKTRFSVQVATESAKLHKQINQNTGTLVFIHESGVKAWLRLIISHLGKIPSGYLKYNQWGALRRDGYETALGMAIDEYKNDLNIYMSDTVSNITSLERNVARFQSVYGLPPGLIIIDYIQLLGGDPTLSDVKQLEDIAARLQDMANEYECQVIALSQLTKQLGGDTTPKWSRAISENATLVFEIRKVEEDRHMVLCHKNRVNRMWPRPIYVSSNPAICEYVDDTSALQASGW